MGSTQQPPAPALTTDPQPRAPGNLRRNVRDLVLAFCSAALCLWLVDVTMLLVRPGTVTRGAVMHGAAGALFLSQCEAILIGVIAGAAVTLTLGDRPLGEEVRSRVRAVWEWLVRGEPQDHVARIGAGIGAIAVFALLSWASLGATGLVIAGVQQPQNVALVVLGVHLGLLIAAAMLWPLARALGRRLSALVARIPGVRRVLWCTMIPAAIGAIALVAAVVVLAVRNKLMVRMLPWETAIKVAVGIGLAVAITAIIRLVLRRLTRAVRLRVGGWVLALAALVGSGIGAFTLKPSHATAREVMGNDILVGRWSMPGAVLALDFDRDGHISMFGGGDCAPFRSSVFPGAADIPNNGIDEDCDGSDLDVANLELWGKSDYSLPPVTRKHLPIVLITIDAFAARHMRAFGYHREVTPAIDRLAERGVFFANAFSQGPSTRLSFPSLFTSRWDSMIERDLNGRPPFSMEPGNVMMAEVLQKAGYYTCAVIPAPYFRAAKWKGINQGFELFDESPADRYKEKTMVHTADRVTEAALKILHSPGPGPLFLWVHYYDAHPPQMQPEGAPAFGNSREDLYDAELLLIDQNVDRLLREVDELFEGQAMVILTADHGNAFDLPRHVKATYGYDLNTITLHVPLIFQGPAFKPRRVEALASTLDILPTIANLFGIKGGHYEGISLGPALVKGEDLRPQAIFHQYYLPEDEWRGKDPLEMIGVHTDQYNLIENRRAGSVALYDWRADYLEKDNLAEKRPEVLKLMRRQLAAFVWHSRRQTKH